MDEVWGQHGNPWFPSPHVHNSSSRVSELWKTTRLLSFPQIDHWPFFMFHKHSLKPILQRISLVVSLLSNTHYTWRLPGVWAGKSLNCAGGWAPLTTKEQRVLLQKMKGRSNFLTFQWGEFSNSSTSCCESFLAPVLHTEILDSVVNCIINLYCILYCWIVL